MKTQDVFENLMRGQSWPSMPEARSAIHAHSLSSEYLFDSLVLRRVIAVQSDGSVQGIAPLEKLPASGRGANEWGEKWPAKLTVCDAFRGQVMNLTALREELKSYDAPNGHWVTLHAIWRLEKEGVVCRVGKGYTLMRMDGSTDADQGDEVNKAVRKRDKETWLKALKKAGSPYEVAAVVAALEPEKHKLDMCVYEWQLMQAGEGGMVETMVEIFRRSGDLPPAETTA